MALTRSDFDSLIEQHDAAIAAGDYAAARILNVRARSVGAAVMASVLQHSAERLEYQQRISGLEKVFDDISAISAESAAASSGGIIRQPVRYVEPTA